MQPYPNYYPMNNYNQYSPMANAQQRLAQMEQQYPQFAQQGQYQPQPQIQMQFNHPQGIIGRAVNDFSEITANDVPMDGRSAVFPKNDMSEIQVRTWGNDGKIITTSYKPILDTKNSNIDISSFESEKLKIGLSDEVRETFIKLFDELESKMFKLEQSLTKSLTKTSTSRSKKEAEPE